MSKADVWMPLYVGDYLADTMHLSTRQHGAYLLLILACWRNDGWVSGDERMLAAITKLDSDEWADDRPLLVEFFKTARGRWSHRRVTVELKKARRQISQKKAAGRASAKSRWDKDKNNSRTIPLQRLDTPSPSPLQERPLQGALLKDSTTTGSDAARERLEGAARDNIVRLARLKGVNHGDD